MKIEKITENKIKIIFDTQDLKENNVSIHSFMSNSIENQNLFLTILDFAEKEAGFSTDNCKISVETLFLKNGNFELIITKFKNESIRKSDKRVSVSRKQPLNCNRNISLYRFDDFEEFCSFCNILYITIPDCHIIFQDKFALYEYHNQYYLLIKPLFLQKKELFQITSILAEFAEFINISPLTFHRLKELGKLIIDHNVISTCQKLNKPK